MPLWDAGAVDGGLAHYTRRQPPYVFCHTWIDLPRMSVLAKLLWDLVFSDQVLFSEDCIKHCWGSVTQLMSVGVLDYY